MYLYLAQSGIDLVIDLVELFQAAWLGMESRLALQYQAVWCGTEQTFGARMGELTTAAIFQRVCV